MGDGSEEGVAGTHPLWPELLELYLKPHFHPGSEDMAPSLSEVESFYLNF